MSAPTDLPAATQAALLTFALEALAYLELDTDWDVQVAGEIGDAACRHGLARWHNGEGAFFAVLPELRAAAGLPEVPRPVFADEDDACPDDPDGQHHTGCGCDAEDGA